MRLTFIGVPIDSVGRSGGTEKGPEALRELGLPALLGGEDAGDLPLRIRGEQRDPESGIIAAADVLTATTAIRAAVSEQVAAGARPLLAGGCCAELPGALAGARDAIGGSLGLVHLDGHADLYDGDTSTTGEAADMPVSVALGLGPATWVEAAGGPSVGAENLALLGYRDRDESIEDGMRQPETLSPTPALCPLPGLRDADPAALASELSDRFAATVPFWLHFDVDALDQNVFPATDYLMPDGLGWEEVRAMLGPLLGSPALVGASIGCYNPEKDPGLACGSALVEVLGASLS